MPLEIARLMNGLSWRLDWPTPHAEGVPEDRYAPLIDVRHFLRRR